MNAIWRGVNRGLRSGYRRLLGRHPQLARAAKSALYPLLLGLNRRLLGTVMPDLTRPAAPAHLRDRYRGHLPRCEGLRISVVMPGYNHAAYLPERLASIAAQSRAPDEIILLDDASTDGSAAILRQWQAGPGAGFDCRLMINDDNSGRPFAQWARGLEAATGDLVWIAESDDLAEPDFLARLAPFFTNPAVTLAFGRSLFVDRDGRTELARMEDQVPPEAAALYLAPFVMPGHAAARAGFAIANLIPNVSGTLLRRPTDLAWTEPAVWTGLRTAGDWLFYLQLLRGGMLAYDPFAVSRYRIHAANSSRAAHRTDAFYAEHGTVLATVARHYGLSAAEHAAAAARLVPVWQAARAEPVARLDALLRLPADDSATRPLRILMLLPGFSGGGAEVAAITLANLLHRRGHTVTVLDMGLEGKPEAEGPGADVQPLRSRLDPDIAVLGDGARLGEIIAGFGIEVVHSHHAWVDQALLATPCRAARVVSLHGMYETLPPAARGELLKVLGRRADGITAAAPSNLTGLPAGRARVIANAVLPARAAPLERAALGVADDAFLCVLVSRAVAEKGWAEAIAAVAVARQQSGREITLLLVGEGPERARLAREGVPDWVRLTGFRPDAPAVLAAADLALLPSRYAGESAPLVVLEALDAGVPVVASRLGRVPEMLSAGPAVAGALVPLREGVLDPRAFGAAIAVFASDSDRLAAARGSIAAVLAVDAVTHMAAAFEAVYRDAIIAARRRASVEGNAAGLGTDGQRDGGADDQHDREDGGGEGKAAPDHHRRQG